MEYIIFFIYSQVLHIGYIINQIFNVPNNFIIMYASHSYVKYSWTIHKIYTKFHPKNNNEHVQREVIIVSQHGTKINRYIIYYLKWING